MVWAPAQRGSSATMRIMAGHNVILRARLRSGAIEESRVGGCGLGYEFIRRWSGSYLRCLVNCFALHGFEQIASFEGCSGPFEFRYRNATISTGSFLLPVRVKCSRCINPGGMEGWRDGGMVLKNPALQHS